MLVEWQIIRLTTFLKERREPRLRGRGPHGYCNFVRVHKALSVIPKMAADVSDRLWELSDMVELEKAESRIPTKRCSYKEKDV